MADDLQKETDAANACDKAWQDNNKTILQIFGLITMAVGGYFGFKNAEHKKK